MQQRMPAAGLLSEYVADTLLRPLDMTHSNFEFNIAGEQLAISYWNEINSVTLAYADHSYILTVKAPLADQK